MSTQYRYIWKKLAIALLIFVTAFSAIPSQASTGKRIKKFPSTSHIELRTDVSNIPGTLPFDGQNRQLSLGELDSLNRPTYAHIQLRDQDEPTLTRETLTYNPVGWFNYKVPYNGKKTWLMNRGHLVGYQFSGLNNEARNLVTMTAYLNTGALSGANDSNPEGMLYYENRLDSWLALHPNYWLDYKVTPVYQDDELVPRQVILQYVGIDSEGQALQISLGGEKEVVDNYGITTVTLENVSPLAEINYETGMSPTIR
ncbi:DNA/RNA non-specific endonuclease [Streptococcus suis]|uniref:DNAse n=1 Tax=Streptococcus suis TaxID=1307 RepID=A0A4T2H019_STRSU|nr:DNA/RNA non-specific endonuclease [Streptococcus suis]MBO3837801.1 DNA/RNA non-specific endonuclease [Streptococcus suis]MBO4114158.1 DNA/RNA non-specific endonuclease [Streptococcus suis]MDG4479864.1 DNA/RNA non-specific endonuclease [Streptococcus suis]MDG4486160.1 DNA/RNA non-specific endonuclease [Streptococcus suis]TII03451.1 DNAse [Streptococcus suis]